MKAGYWINEEPYEVLGDAKTDNYHPGGPKRARLAIASSTVNGSLFHNINLYVQHTKIDYFDILNSSSFSSFSSFLLGTLGPRN